MGQSVLVCMVHAQIAFNIEYILYVSLGKEFIPEKFGSREEVPIEERVVKNEHLISSSGSLHLWHQQAISIGCTGMERKVAQENEMNAKYMLQECGCGRQYVLIGS